MKQIKSILADADGTLIEGGNFQNFPPELKGAIANVRSDGILFNLASGRPFFEQEILYDLLIGDENKNPQEGILYEGSSLKMFDKAESFVLGGLKKDQVQEIKAFIVKHDLCVGLVPQSNNDKYETQTGYVTPPFITEGRTDLALLQSRFPATKDAIERQFPYAEVSMSADAIDVFARGVTKAKPTAKYSQVTGISLDQIAVFGDSGNDMPMFEVVGKEGGLTVYVGTNPEQEKIINSYKHHFIPEQRGPLGVVQGLEYILKLNQE
ncbi:HAD-IIB family hydrolase [Candidatus Woesearchaeota archaeon]|jgi:HAD superfamily hydrolase (TIGR01484 family)|nr:HAD-IIB family hydrolase [Candidatus Woesearchaeota archaeon]